MIEPIIFVLIGLIAVFLAVDTILGEIRTRQRRRREAQAAADLVDMTTRMEQEPNRFWFRTGRDSAIADMHDALRNIETKDEP